jgi:hypothetical protein
MRQGMQFLQILLPQHVSGTNMPIIRSTISEYLPLLGGHIWKAAWVVPHERPYDGDLNSAETCCLSD